MNPSQYPILPPRSSRLPWKEIAPHYHAAMAYARTVNPDIDLDNVWHEEFVRWKTLQLMLQDNPRLRVGDVGDIYLGASSAAGTSKVAELMDRASGIAKRFENHL